MQEFVKCLQAYIKKEQLDNIDDSNALLKIALEQSLQTILYPVYRNSLYKKYYVSWVAKQEQFFDVQKDITNIFNEHNIKHLFFKGSVLAYLFDDPSIRTRGDIDVYVDVNDIDNAKNLLSKNGYALEIISNTHHINLSKYGIEVELHFAMLDDAHSKGIVEYFSKPFELSVKKENSLYVMNDTEHFIFCLEHFAHHLRRGAGIRYMLDFYYMLKKTNIDFDKLHKDLYILNLSKLYNNVLNVIYYLSNEKIDKFEETDINYFIDYMLKSGIHGFGKDNDFGSGDAVSKNKWGWIKTRLFLTDKTYRIVLFPKIGNKIILYPICLIIHIFKLTTTGLFRRTKLLFKILFKKNKKKDLYNELGI